MPANTYGRQVVLPLTNKSGGGVIAGDVVVIDTTNNDAFTTTTSAGFTGGIGIAQETIASNAIGRVLIGGYAALVNVNASVTRGHYGATHTVAKQAADAGAARTVGTFCQFLTGGTTPDAVVFPVDLQGSALTNPMTTKGDIIIADTGGTPTRLAATTSGYVLTAQGAGAFPAWAAAGGGISQSYVGYNTVGASKEAIGTTVAIVKSVTLASAAVILTIEMYVDQAADNIYQIPAVGVWADASGAAGKVLVGTAPSTAYYGGPVATYPARWIAASCGLYVPAGTYWIGFGRGPGCNLYYDTSGSDRTWTLGADTTFPDGARWTQSDTTKKYSIRASILS